MYIDLNTNSTSRWVTLRFVLNKVRIRSESTDLRGDGRVSAHRAKQREVNVCRRRSRIRTRSESIYQILKWTLPNYRSGLNWPATNSPLQSCRPRALIQRSVSSVFPWMPLAYFFCTHILSLSLSLALFRFLLYSPCASLFYARISINVESFPHFPGPRRTTNGDSIFDRSFVNPSIVRQRYRAAVTAKNTGVSCKFFAIGLLLCPFLSRLP